MKLILIICLGFLLPLVCQASYVGYYKMNNNSNDYSATANNGSDTAVTYVPGKVREAGKFNGSSSKVTLTSVAKQRIGTWTVSIIVRTSNPNRGQEPASYISSQGAGGTWGGWEINYSNPTLWNFYASNAYKTIVLPTPVTATSTWAHLTFKNDGTNMYYYKDGQLIKSGVSGGNTSFVNTVYPRIGAGGYTSDYFFWLGELDEYVYDDSQWSQQKIKTDYMNKWGKLE